MSQRSHLVRRAVLANNDSQATETFKQELYNRVDLSPALEASVAPSATDTAPESDATNDFNAQFKDTFNKIDWKRLPLFIKPLRTQKHKKLWIYKHRY
jgi:hypothetical protein